MATEKKLDCVILGLLCHEDLTGYEIKKRMDTTLKYFWGASYGSIYPTLNDLVNRGMAIRREDGASKRNKQIYSITDNGRKYMKEWLKSPVEKDELRYETLLKLFFGNEQGASQTMLHIAAFQEKIDKELHQLLNARNKLKECIDEDSVHKYYFLTVEFGITTYRSYLKWCEEAIGLLERMRE